MKQPLWLQPLTCLCLLFPAVVSAQTTTPSTATKDDILELSPFVVEAADQEGYYSNSSTAGSRLKTNLKDIAASVSVLTEDFMNDLGATDVASALAFVSGAENDSTYHQEGIAGLGSANGYVGGDFGDNNNRSGEIRVRGLGRATTTINYMEVLGSTDRYNTDRTEFLRGANSILFGLAEPAGLVNSSTKIANFRANKTKVETKVDNLGSTRLVLDVNHVLLKDKLAIRAVGLTQKQQYEVDTAYLQNDRIFLTSTYRPFRNTTVRAYYENFKTFGRRPNNRTVQDNVSEWLTAYNTYAPMMTQAQIDAAFFWDPFVPNANGVAPDSIINLGALGTVNLGLIRRPLDSRPNGTTLIWSGNGQWDTPLDNLVTIMANRTQTGGAASPTNSRTQFARSGSDRENNPSFRADPQVTDKGIFPYDSVEIAALPGAYRWEKDHKYYGTIDQKITDDLYLSASFQHETWDEEQYFPAITQTNQISLDITKRLPDGRVNPNFLRPFIYGRSIGERINNSVRNVLVQANYDFDFAKRTNRFGWLGSHRLTGLFTSTKNDRLRYQWQMGMDSETPDALQGGAASSGSNQRWAMQMWYVGEPVRLGDTSLRFTGFPDNTAAHWDKSYGMLYYNNSTKTWQQTTDSVHFGRMTIGGGRSYTVQKNDGLGFSLQSFFWKRKIVTLLGWRQDKVDSFQGILKDAALYPFPTIPGVTRSDYETEGSVYKNKANTTTQSIVYKVTDKLRVFANRSENFAATTPRQDNLYRPLPPQSGKTDEFGLGLTLLDGRLDIRAIHFKSSQLGASSSGAVAGLRIPPFENRLRSALEAAGRLSEWYTIDTLGGQTTDEYTRPNNGTSTEDLVSKGNSVEITFRPNRNWDFMLSVDQIDNVKTNVGKEVGDFLAVRAPFYKKYFDEGLRLDGTTGNTTSNSTLVRDDFVNTIATNWINEILGEGISNRGLAEYTARLVGRYKFHEGRLRGLNIGANLRWESGKSIGYAEVPTTFNFGGLDGIPGNVSDTSNPYYGDAVIAGGMFVSYSRKILNGRVNWRVQLNAQNLFSQTGLRVIAANADGSPVWARNPDHSFELSNSFEF
jgi:hypothetical protein